MVSSSQLGTAGSGQSLTTLKYELVKSMTEPALVDTKMIDILAQQPWSRRGAAALSETTRYSDFGRLLRQITFLGHI